MGEVSAVFSKLTLSFVAQGINLPLTSITVTDFSEDSDVIGSPEQTLGNLVVGASGKGRFSATGEKGATFVIKLLQGSTESIVVDEVIKLQQSGIASVVVSGLLVQTDSGQVDTLTEGYFTTWVPIGNRGKGEAQSMPYTIQFVGHDKIAI